MKVNLKEGKEKEENREKKKEQTNEVALRIQGWLNEKHLMLKTKISQRTSVYENHFGALLCSFIGNRY